jgi:uncharacterized protein YqgC (DUF456 family)
VFFQLLRETAWGPSAPADLQAQQVALFMGTTLLLILILAAGHVAIVLFNRDTQQDERDRLIALKGSQIGAFMLATGVFAALCTATITEGNAIMACVLLGFWILAESTEIVARLVLYRRGS